MSEAGRFAAVLRTAPLADRWILLITFGLTVFVDLIVAVNVGVILAVLQFLRRMAETVDTQPVAARSLKAELAGRHGTSAVRRAGLRDLRADVL